MTGHNAAAAPATTTITIARVFDAPRELVFQAWIDPAHIVHWFYASDGWTTPFAETDPRPGGAFRIGFASADGKGDFTFEGVYDEVVAPERLLFTIGDGRPAVVTFAEHDGKTKLDLVLTLESTYSEEQQREGWTAMLVHLGEYLAKVERTMTKLDLVAAPGAATIVITRILAAPRTLVFKAFTDPALIPHWWGPRRHTTTVDVMDAAPGGTWRFVSRDAVGNEFAFHGVYREIEAPERLSYTFEFEGMPGYVSLEMVTLEERNGKTTVTNTVAFHTVEDRDGMLASGMESGATESMERLGELLRTMA